MPYQAHTPKIDPSRRAARPSEFALDVGAPGNPAHAEWRNADLAEPDMATIRAYRLGRIREQLVARDAAGALLYDPLNIRYATDSSNMQIWTMHNAVRYCFIATQGPVVLFDFHNCGHLSADLPLIDETRNATSWFYFGAGPNERVRVKSWASELADLVYEHGGGNTRLLIDTCDQLGIEALKAQGIQPESSQAFTELARVIKHPEEIKAMRRAIHTSEVGMARMWENLHPGMTENQLWSILHQANIARGGEWIETRLLASGPRTNPWFQECSNRVIEAGDMVSFDTDLVGPYGYCADISRSWITPGRQASNAQLSAHAIASEHLAYNMDLLKPGMSYSEFAEKGYALPDDCRPNRYSVVAHGVGLCDEYPAIAYPEDMDDYGYDGVFEPGMVLCFESYVGPAGAKEGVKLEKQALITETGIEILDQFPMALTPEL